MSSYYVLHGIKISRMFTPETYGYLTTLGPGFRMSLGRCNQQATFQVCECRCGVVKVVRTNYLKLGHTKSCGCLWSETVTRATTTHGKCRTPEYRVWQGMRRRCCNSNASNFEHYGGRGIAVCARWLDTAKGFENFYSDMGPRPTSETPTPIE